MTNAVFALSPTPPPHSPGPGRSVSSKVAIVYFPDEIASVSFAPHGRDWLKISTCLRLVNRSGGVPFWTTLGIANRSLAAGTSPARSSSAQLLITWTASESASPVTVPSSDEDPQPPKTTRPRAKQTAATHTAAEPTIALAVIGPSWQCQVAALDPALHDARHAHRTARRAPALGWAARIEDLEALALLVQRHVGVAKDDGVRIREADPHPVQTALGRSGVMDHPERRSVEIQRQRLGQLAPQLRAVDVAVDRDDRPELPELCEHGRLAEVAGVDGQVGGAHRIDTWLRQPAGTPGQVRIGDQSYSDCSSSLRLSERSRSASFRSR